MYIKLYVLRNIVCTARTVHTCMHYVSIQTGRVYLEVGDCRLMWVEGYWIAIYCDLLEVCRWLSRFQQVLHTKLNGRTPSRWQSSACKQGTRRVRLYMSITTTFFFRGRRISHTCLGQQNTLRMNLNSTSERPLMTNTLLYISVNPSSVRWLEVRDSLSLCRLSGGEYQVKYGIHIHQMGTVPGKVRGCYWGPAGSSNNRKREGGVCYIADWHH